MRVRAVSLSIAVSLVATFGILSHATAASLGKPLSSGLLNTGNNGPLATTSCLLINVGTKPIAVRTVSVFVGTAGTPGEITSDTCTTGPVDPGKGCSFAGGGGVSGGGTARIVGDIKNVRGNCVLQNDSGVTVQTAPMR